MFTDMGSAQLCTTQGCLLHHDEVGMAGKERTHIVVLYLLKISVEHLCYLKDLLYCHLILI